MFYTWSLPRNYLENNFGDPVQFREFCMGGFEEETRAREAEESPLLEAVAREQLMKTERDVKGLASAVVICRVWSLAVKL
jgi:hypothetical protein